MNIVEKLKSFKVEVTPEMEKAFSGEYLSELEVEKKLGKAENDRDSWKKRAETAEETLKGFDGKDLETITKERDEWKQKAEQAEKDFQKQIEERDYKDAVEEAVKDLKFTSNSAKKAFMSDLMADPLKMKEGKLIGFSDYVSAYKESDASAFVDEEQENNNNNAAHFTDPMSKDQNQQEPVTGDPNKMDFATYKKWRAQNQ